MNEEQAAKLRSPFKPEQIGQLPKAGTTLSYVGHAAVTARLLEVDSEWTWEPVAWAANGTPLWASDGGDAVMWIKLTVAGVTRFGVGICKNNAFELEKQLISDAIRNAAMRFGVALDLWSKEDLSAENAGAGTGETDSSERTPSVAHEPPAPAIFVPGQASMDSAQARCKALAAAGIDILKARTEAKLPPLSRITDEAQWLAWQLLLDDLGVQADELAAKANA